MLELQGKHNSAKVFTDNIEESAISQIIELLNQPFCEGQKIRIMPDVHAGAGCTIGTTMTISDKVVPNMVGVDIGCGMETVVLENENIEFGRLDKKIRELIPSGMSVRDKIHRDAGRIDLEKIRAKGVDLKRAKLSVGTLGGGNHFIEIDKDEDGRLYLVIHSGSRNMGKQIAEYYQREAIKALKTGKHAEVIAKLKAEGKQKQIEKELRKLPAPVPPPLSYAEGILFDDYINDMEIAQEYAALNRQTMAKEIINAMNLKVSEQFTTIHNYIDIKNMILRKGAISAQNGERVLIPINMRDGSLICIGKGNADWNFSAPHGAGRIMSRSKAKETVSLSDYKKSMDGIFSTSVNRDTIDESPFAYKDASEIIGNIGDTADIVKVIKPVYNFKASD